MKSTPDRFCNIVLIIMIGIYLSGCAWVNAAGRTYEGAGEGLKKASDETEPGFSKTVFDVSGKICSAVGQILVDASGEDISPSDAAETTETKQQDEKIIVTKVQKRLIELGYDPGPVDGCMGPKTTEAIRAYQSDNQMSPSGDITSELVESLEI
jgi:hypothetical protein